MLGPTFGLASGVSMNMNAEVYIGFAVSIATRVCCENPAFLSRESVC